MRSALGPQIFSSPLTPLASGLIGPGTWFSYSGGPDNPTSSLESPKTSWFRAEKQKLSNTGLKIQGNGCYYGTLEK